MLKIVGDISLEVYYEVSPLKCHVDIKTLQNKIIVYPSTMQVMS